jgi:hypothetical protein
LNDFHIQKNVGAIIFDFEISTKNNKFFILSQELLDFALNNLFQKAKQDSGFMAEILNQKF